MATFLRERESLMMSKQKESGQHEERYVIIKHKLRKCNSAILLLWKIKSASTD